MIIKNSEHLFHEWQNLGKSVKTTLSCNIPSLIQNKGEKISEYELCEWALRTMNYATKLSIRIAELRDKTIKHIKES